MLKKNQLIVGIDLGTTHSSIGLHSTEGVRLVPNAHGSVLTPSVVGVDDCGEVLVGTAAYELGLKEPRRAVQSFKRFMGSAKITELGGLSFRPEELSALVLRSLVDDFQAITGRRPVEAVVSCPAYFNDPQRKATLVAAKHAGINVKKLVNEPTAAILAHGLFNEDDGQFLVIDLGGGTFDVSILHKFGGVLEIRSSAGDNFLGGDDFTAALKTILKRKSPDPSKLSEHWCNRAAERLKRALSIEDEVPFRQNDDQAYPTQKINRAEFEASCRLLLARLRKPIQRVLHDGSVLPDELDCIVLAGGATRMPMVQYLIGELFPGVRVESSRPDEIVAIGATLQSALISRLDEFEDYVLTDVCPYTLGINIRKSVEQSRVSVVSPIIERNSTVPVSRSDRFHTLELGQSSILVQVFQGENLYPEDNVLIGDLRVPVPVNFERHESIDVRFTYDVNGALEVEVTVVSTRDVYRKIFAGVHSQSESDLEARFKFLAGLKIVPREQLPNRELLSRAERLHAEALGGVRIDIAEAVLRFTHNISGANPSEMNRHRDLFRKFLDAKQRQIWGDGP